MSDNTPPFRKLPEDARRATQRAVRQETRADLPHGGAWVPSGVERLPAPLDGPAELAGLLRLVPGLTARLDALEDLVGQGPVTQLSSAGRLEALKTARQHVSRTPNARVMNPDARMQAELAVARFLVGERAD